MRRENVLIWVFRIIILFENILAATSFLVKAIPRRHGLKSSDTLNATTEKLECLTVKELRLLVKEQNPSERGLLSKLKRKRDLVDFLSSQNNGEALECTDTKEVQTRDVKNGAEGEDVRPSARLPLKMPSKEPTLSLKDALLKRVVERYPDATEEADEAVDFRQVHHPMTASRTQTDMDVVFLGTASCMPGITRGVSCTAIKLNWRRTGSSTWIFDAGECSQVCTDCCRIKPFDCANDDYF